MNSIAQAFLAACLVELDALKPGNVHRHAAGHDMSVADFERSAAVSAPAVARPGARLGARARTAVQATRAAVGKNTNLGIVLLCAPLAVAAERARLSQDAPSLSLRAPLAAVLAESSRDDARDIYAAIVEAGPGGLGAARYDVRDAPDVPLREAMAEAAPRDLIARQYVTDFADVFGLGDAALRAARAGAASESEAAEAVYLAFLSTHPDSHVARKFGWETAEALRREAAARPRDRASLAAFDADLKARGLNPGTSADLTVATLFANYASGSHDRQLAGMRQR